jgi:predicted nuclease of predicted toxin-antitoxin system
MRFWIDAQLPPSLARWIAQEFGTEAVALRDLGLRDARDSEIFQAARSSSAVILTKDSDFVELVYARGPPPQVIWITCGNSTNRHLQRILTATFPNTLRLLEQGEAIVEIADIQRA